MGTRIGAITFGGLSSGLPTEEIIGKLLDLSRRPITLLEQQREGENERLALFQDLNSKTAALRDALRGLDNMANVVRRAGDSPRRSAFEEFRRYEALSSDEARATATAARNAVPGSLVFSIEQLAQQHRSLSGTYASSSAVVTAGGGTLNIAVGSGAPTPIAIAAGASVQDVIDAINAEGIDATAFAIDDGQGAVRIAIVGDKTGSTQNLTLTNDFGLTLTEVQSARNARIVLDPDGTLPIAIERPTNSFENLLQGLSIQAKAPTGSGERVTVSVQTSTEAVKEAIAEVVDAYNAITKVIREQNTVDPTTNRGGPLLGDSTVVSLAQRLGAMFGRAYGEGSITTPRQLGMVLGRGGELTLDEAALDAALASDFEGVAGFFSGEGSFSDRMREVADSFVDPIDGSLAQRISGTTARIADLRESIERAEERLETVEENLVRQFAALERTLSQLQEQANFLTSFLLGQSR